MKKKVFSWAAVTVLVILFFLYFESFMSTAVDNLSLAVNYENENGWKISGIKNGKEVGLTATQAIEHPETVFLRRPVTEDWLYYSRIQVDTGRAVLVFIDDELVFSNYPTQLSKPGALPLMQSPQNQPFSMVFSVNPVWLGKTATIVTRLYANQPYASIDFTLVSDHILLEKHEVWVTQKVLPGALFGALFLLFMGLFTFVFITEKKGFPLLYLAFASLLQMFCYMSALKRNPLPLIDSGIATALYFLFPLLYLGTKLIRFRKPYFIAVVCVWSVYFLLYLGIYVFYLPLPYGFDKAEILCFLLLGIMLYYGFKERQNNVFLRRFLSVLGMIFAGFLALFLITAALDMPLSYIVIALFKEALNLYCRPLLFWVFTIILFALFVLSVWDLLQKEIDAAKQMEQLQSEQNILNLQIEAAKGQINVLRATDEQTRIYRHDMRHHLSFISECVAKGKTDQLQGYFAAVQGDIDKLTPLRFCENEIFNLILTFFADKAKKLDIAFKADVELPRHLALSDTELCVVLSNGLENAIAAAALGKKGNRAVRISSKINGNKLLILIENTFVNPVVLENGLPKAQRQGHGFGTKSMATIAQKRNGYFACAAKDGVFVMRMMLSLEEASSQPL